MAKRKHAADWILARAREYLSGKGSDRQITRSNGLSGRSLLGWVRKYEEQGEASFMERAGNASCSKEFKVSCVLTALRGEGNVDDIVVKYNISSHSVLRHWIKQYQERFGVRTPMEVRAAGLNAKIPEQFLIAENKRIQKYNAKFVA